MPEHIKALVVILVLNAFCMLVMRKPALQLGIKPRDYTRRCIGWVWITAAAFLAHNFWLFLLGAGIWLLLVSRRDENPASLYLHLLFVLPPFAASISGFGILQQLFEISYTRLLSLLVLLPAFALIIRRGRQNGQRFGFVDLLVVLFLVLAVVRQLAVDTFTNTLRHGFYAFIDVFLPYYVMSRLVLSSEDRRQVFFAFVTAMMLIAPIAVFEFFKGWLLYTSLPMALGLPPPEIPAYIGRGSFIRAVASSGQPIVLGYMMTIAVLFYFVFERAKLSTKYWALGLLAILAGIIVPLSRGPWVGLAAGLLVMAFTTPKPGVWFIRFSLIFLVLLPVLTLTNFGKSIVDMLPFIGSVDSGNVVYRQMLIDAALVAISDSPWFGSADFLHHPAFRPLDQGGGAIDFTNSYVLVALMNGLVGLFLFVGVFVVLLIQLFRTLLNEKGRKTGLLLEGRVLLAAIVATMVTIATVSSISFIPTVYWCLCGLSVGYLYEVKRERRFQPSLR